ncbi:MAG: mannose-1-phosphate guanylyltransferase/mannose-6-phosphate isomerase [Nitrospinota bacterium]|nr:mannose-1-phosphate guanylyltransferase/mannose-6-phosphate isomerase [Nitrospinota bacterium]
MYGVILAGGSGTRFWPVSREQNPKQLQNIVGTGTMIQNTVQRLLPLIPVDKLRIGTHTQQATETIRQLESFGFLPNHLLAEPCSRNTALIIGLMAKIISADDPDSVMAVFPSDHVVTDTEKFIQVIQKAETMAKKGYLVTLGIPPKQPETGFGYIKQGSKTKEDENVFQVEHFVEKPDLNKAKEYFKSRSYFWNCGVFVWKTSVILEELQQHAGNIYSQLENLKHCLQKSGKKLDHIELDEKGSKIFSVLPNISIDFAVMEKSSKVVFIPADIGWNDVGSWNALDEVCEKDKAGNILKGNVLIHDCNDSIVYGQDRLVATLGLTNTVVVDTKDALLVCAKDRSQDIKKLVEELNKKGCSEVKVPAKVKKPWGSYTVLDSGSNFLLKRIEVLPGESLSLQSHKHRSEHWTVAAGSAKVELNEDTFHLEVNDSIIIPLNAKHRLGNPGSEILIIFEIQFGNLLDENDILRHEDLYGRR